MTIMDGEKEELINGTHAYDGHVNQSGAQGYGSVQDCAAADSQSESSHSTAFDSEQQGNDELRLLQAQVFLEDAAMYRSVNHKVDEQSLKIYGIYHSRLFSLLRGIVIFVLHMLAFVEFPSSLSWTSDIKSRGERLTLPCGVTEGMELVCLLLLLGDVIIKYRVYGSQYLRINRWLVGEILALSFSMIDWSISVGIGCREVIRVRRMLRPVFIIQNSSLMKKILNSLRKTMSQIFGVLLLMALHLYIFTLFGMLLFPKPDKATPAAIIHNSTENNNETNSGGESEYFRTLTDSFISLLVLLTTANNPDGNGLVYGKYLLKNCRCKVVKKVTKLCPQDWVPVMKCDLGGQRKHLCCNTKKT